MKRYLSIGKDGQKLELSKVTAINNDNFESIHIDKLKNGTWRLIYSSKLIPDISKIDGIEIVRED